MDDEIRRALLEDEEHDDQLQQSELYEILQRSHDINHNVKDMIHYQQQEHMRQLETYDVLLADLDLDEFQVKEILLQQADHLQQLENLQQMQQQFEDRVPDTQFSMEDEELFHREVLVEEQLDEQVREISQYQAAMSSLFTHRIEPSLCQQPRVPLDRNRSFKGYILNPNQDEVEDGSSNSYATMIETQHSPGSLTTILSADFGDDDVFPIEETSCVICCVEYRHGDEILRNANGCDGSSSASSSRNNAIVSSCNHVFHTKCITSWIETSRKTECPCCRRQFALSGPT